MLPLSRSLCAALIAAGSGTVNPLGAQAPFDQALVLEAPDPNTLTSSFRFVDPFGRGVTLLRDQRVFAPFAGAALDPDTGRELYFLNGAASLPGVWQAQLGGSTFAITAWGPWGMQPGCQIAVGSSDVFFVDGTSLWSVPRQGGTAPSVLTSLAGGSDVAVDGPQVYASAYAIGSPGLLIEYDTALGRQRTLGAYNGVLAITVSSATTLLAATDAGDLLTIDRASGRILARTNPGKGAIDHVVVTSNGVPVFVAGNDVWSTFDLTAPIYTAQAAIVGFDIGRADVATAYRYGEGCGSSLSFVPSHTFTGVPAIGNQGFAVGVENGLPGVNAILALGGSRVTSTSFGPLPRSLASLGQPPACTLLADPVVTGSTTLDATGVGQLPLPVPANAALKGLVFYSQWFVTDPRVGTLRLAVSEGAALEIR